MRSSVAFFFVFIFFSCSGDKLPDGIIPKPQMQELLWDYLRADVYTTDYIATDSTKNAAAESIALQKYVFKKHKVTKEQFYTSYQYYLKHPALMVNILDSMLAIQNRKEIVAKSDTAHNRKREENKYKVQ